MTDLDDLMEVQADRDRLYHERKALVEVAKAAWAIRLEILDYDKGRALRDALDALPRGWDRA